MPGFFSKLMGNEPKDINLPMPEGGRRDPRIPKDKPMTTFRGIADGLKVAREATKAKAK